MTRFVILRAGKGTGWYEAGLQEAPNAEAAVKAAYLKKPDAETVAMVAVPARSWKPTSIRTETVQKVVLGGQPEPTA